MRQWGWEDGERDEWTERAMNPDGQIRVLLFTPLSSPLHGPCREGRSCEGPSGAVATVAPDVSLKTLMALDEMAALAIAHCLEETKGLLP